MKSLSGSARIAERFAALRRARRRAFIPFVMAGDPSLRITEMMVPTLVEAGADLIELGVPFSDPLADGPTIQRASARALVSGTTLADVLRLVRRVRARCSVPLVLLTYYNLIAHRGVAAFCRQAAVAGVDGVVVPDLPPEEGGELIGAARRTGLATIFLAAPTSTRERVRRVDRATTGFIYYVSVTGTTGARRRLPTELIRAVRQVRRQVRWPVCIGFGISTPAQARRLAAVADGVIVGSAIVGEMERALPRARRRHIGRFVRRLADATHGVGGDDGSSRAV